jgi:hypothetical protein
MEPIVRWSEFSRRGEPSTERVTAEEMEIETFQKPVTPKWHQVVPRNNLSKLLNGFDPSAMEDK